MVKGLFRHLGATRRAAKDQKLLTKAPVRKGLELEFLPAYLEVIERPPSRVGRSMGIAIMLLCVTALVWSIYGKLDVISSAPGKVIVGEYSKTIQAAEAGVVSRIAAWNGQAVVEGDVLIELNPTAAQADVERLRWQVEAAHLGVDRYQALLSDDPLAEFAARQDLTGDLQRQVQTYLLGEWETRQATRDTAQSQSAQNAAQQVAAARLLSQTEQLLETVVERYDATAPLVDQGNFPRLQLLQLRQEVIEQRRTVAEQEANLDALVAQAQALITDYRRQDAEWRQTVLQRLEENRTALFNLRQELIKAEETARLQTIFAPVSGVVQQQTVHTIGGVVSAGQALMMIVPETGDLEAEVNILNRDVGFIHPGQLVEVKIESFPFTKYGTIKGEVVNISRDSIADENLGLVYPAQIRLDGLGFVTEGETIPLSAGMLLTAEIKTGDRRVIDYLLSPLQEIQSVAMRER